MEPRATVELSSRRFKGSRYVICVGCGRTVDLNRDRAYVGQGGWLCCTCGDLERSPSESLVELVRSYRRRMTLAYDVLSELASRTDIFPPEKIDVFRQAESVIADLLAISHAGLVETDAV